MWEEREVENYKKMERSILMFIDKMKYIYINYIYIKF